MGLVHYPHLWHHWLPRHQVHQGAWTLDPDLLQVKQAVTTLDQDPREQAISTTLNLDLQAEGMKERNVVLQTCCLQLRASLLPCVMITQSWQIMCVVRQQQQARLLVLGVLPLNFRPHQQQHHLLQLFRGGQWQLYLLVWSALRACQTGIVAPNSAGHEEGGEDREGRRETENEEERLSVEETEPVVESRLVLASRS